MENYESGQFKKSEPKNMRRPPQVITKQESNKKQAYKKRFEKLLSIENDEESKSIMQRLKTWSKEQLMANGLALFDAKAYPCGLSYGSQLVHFKLRFKAGDMVMISNVSPLTEDSLNGVISEVTPQGIIVALKSNIPSTTKTWRVDKAVDQVEQERCSQALERLITSSNNDPASYLTDILIADKGHKLNDLASTPITMVDPATGKALPPRNQPQAFSRQFTKMVNESINNQQSICTYAALTNRLTLLQGPPGTGKTYSAICLVRCMLQIYQGTAVKILVTAHTNLGLDNLAEGLSNAGIDCVRVGQPEKVLPILRESTLRAKAEVLYNVKFGDTFKGPATRMDKSTEASLMKEVLKEAKVVCATCIGSGQPMLDNLKFSIVIIDEASQANEPSMLIPITKGSQQVICLGDQNQLPPPVFSMEAKKGGLDKSLFERLILDGITPLMFSDQYRMHPDIAYFPNTHFYAGKLQNAITEKDRPAPTGFPWPSSPVAFIHIDGSESSNGKSYYNSHEGVVIQQVVEDLIQAGEDPQDIGVIAMYDAQANYLGKRLPMGVMVSTVDGFQGREKKIIVISCVRSNTSQTIGFVADKRRINVALTRAKNGLIVVGNGHTLEKDVTFSSWLQWMFANDRCVAIPLRENGMQNGHHDHASVKESNGGNEDMRNANGKRAREDTSQSATEKRQRGGSEVEDEIRDEDEEMEEDGKADESEIESQPSAESSDEQNKSDNSGSEDEADSNDDQSEDEAEDKTTTEKGADSEEEEESNDDKMEEGDTADNISSKSESEDAESEDEEKHEDGDDKDKEEDEDEAAVEDEEEDKDATIENQNDEENEQADKSGEDNDGEVGSEEEASKSDSESEDEGGKVEDEETVEKNEDDDKEDDAEKDDEDEEEEDEEEVTNTIAANEEEGEENVGKDEEEEDEDEDSEEEEDENKNEAESKSEDEGEVDNEDKEEETTKDEDEDKDATSDKEDSAEADASNDEAENKSNDEGERSEGDAASENDSEPEDASEDSEKEDAESTKESESQDETKMEDDKVSGSSAEEEETKESSSSEEESKEDEKVEDGSGGEDAGEESKIEDVGSSKDSEKVEEEQKDTKPKQQSKPKLDILSLLSKNNQKPPPKTLPPKSISFSSTFTLKS